MEELETDEPEEPLGCPPMPPPRRHWGVSRYLSLWANTQPQSKDGIPLTNMRQASSQVFYSLSFTWYPTVLIVLLVHKRKISLPVYS
jgi:hypothetical protein